MEERPTQKDIARRVGVSRPLVSAVLAGRSDRMRASDETRRRILQVAEELGYRPQPGDAAPRADAPLIGVVLWGPHLVVGMSDFWLPFWQSLETSIRRTGCDMLTFGSLPGEAAALRARRYADRNRIDALVLTGHMDLERYAPLREITKIPMLGTFPRHGPLPLDIPWIDVDDEDGIQSACQVCYDFGHRRLLYVRQVRSDGEAAEPLLPERYAAYRSFCSERGLTPLSCPVDLSDVPGAPSDSHPLANRPLLEAAAAALGPALRERLATAVVCESEPLAFGVYHAAAELGIAIPDELSVIAFDDRYAISADPPMASVSHMLREVGELAAERVAEQIAAGTVLRTAQRELVEPDIVLRQSLAPPSGRHGLR